MSENDVLTWGCVLDKWLSFKPVIFVLSLYRVISKQTCLDTSGLSERAFTGNLYCLLSSWNRTDDYMSAPESFGSPCALVHDFVMRSWSSRSSCTFLALESQIEKCFSGFSSVSVWVEGGDLCASCMPCMVMQAVLYLDVSPPAWKKKVRICLTHAHARTHKHTPAYFFHIPHVRRSVIGWSSKWLERNFFFPVRSFNWLFTG